MDPNRRAFLRGAFLRGGARKPAPALRPPWAVEAFLERCTRCDACIAACPEKVLRRGDGGFPELDVRERGCTFCAACVEACEPGALDRRRGVERRHRATIGPTCLARREVTCRLCELACEEDAIGFILQRGGVATPLVDASQCTGCGMCLNVCPSHAISLEERSE